MTTAPHLPSGSGTKDLPLARRAIEPIPDGAVPVMEAINLSKAFGATIALVDVSLKAHAGRILALLGDNGAGKSTLIKILSGVFPPDRGELRFRGERVILTDPAQARALGIATVALLVVAATVMTTNWCLPSFIYGRLPARRAEQPAG